VVGHPYPGDRALDDDAGVAERPRTTRPGRDPVAVGVAVEGHPDRPTAHLRPVAGGAADHEHRILDVHGRGIAVVGEKPDADVHGGQRRGDRAAVVVVQDLPAGPALVDRVSEGAVLAHAPAVPPPPAVDDHRSVVGGCHRTLGRCRHTGNPQRLADGDQVGIGEAVCRHDRTHRHAEAAGDLGEGVTGLHDHDQQGNGGGGRHEPRNGQPLPDVDQVGIGDAVLRHEVGNGDGVPEGDQREALPGLHGDDRRTQLRHLPDAAGNQQFLAHEERVGVGQAVQRQQLGDRHAVVLGYHREAVAPLHHHDRRRCGGHGTHTRDDQGLAHEHQVGIGQAVGGHQVGERHTVLVGDPREAVTGPDQHDGVGHGRTHRRQGRCEQGHHQAGGAEPAHCPARWRASRRDRSAGWPGIAGRQVTGRRDERNGHVLHVSQVSRSIGGIRQTPAQVPLRATRTHRPTLLRPAVSVGVGCRPGREPRQTTPLSRPRRCADPLRSAGRPGRLVPEPSHKHHRHDQGRDRHGGDEAHLDPQEEVVEQSHRHGEGSHPDHPRQRHPRL